jgi:hypothetical protein
MKMCCQAGKNEYYGEKVLKYTAFALLVIVLTGIKQNKWNLFVKLILYCKDCIYKEFMV